mmetsp:Transcript_5033/g.9707  ORF Transcript_5033/g.9707 Transcript_5033/m.9707 type:complete len:119 (-) Transcript_5033:2028-2384(-)
MVKESMLAQHLYHSGLDTWRQVGEVTSRSIVESSNYGSIQPSCSTSNSSKRRTKRWLFASRNAIGITAALVLMMFAAIVLDVAERSVHPLLFRAHGSTIPSLELLRRRQQQRSLRRRR